MYVAPPSAVTLAGIWSVWFVRSVTEGANQWRSVERAVVLREVALRGISRSIMNRRPCPVVKVLFVEIVGGLATAELIQ